MPTLQSLSFRELRVGDIVEIRYYDSVSWVVKIKKLDPDSEHFWGPYYPERKYRRDLPEDVFAHPTSHYKPHGVFHPLPNTLLFRLQ